MAYYLDLFSPETYEAFKGSDQTVSGFRSRQQNAANRLKTGDKLVCYLTKLSRWMGLLEVVSGPYLDKTPLFTPDPDPFIVRVKVSNVAWLDIEKAIPIHEDHIWNSLSFTRGHNKNAATWTGKVRVSLSQLDDSDGKLLEKVILEQLRGGRPYPIDRDAYSRLKVHRVQTSDKSVPVSVPDDSHDSDEGEAAVKVEVRESINIQALVAKGGARRGCLSGYPETIGPRYLAIGMMLLRQY